MEMTWIIIFFLAVLWLLTFGLYLREKKRERILRKNSDWATDKAREKAEKIISECS